MDLDLAQDAMALATAMVEPFNRRDFDAMIAMGGGSVDYTDVALGQRITDPAEFRAVMQGWVGAFSDLRATITSAARDGDVLAYEVRFDGTHDGTLQTPMGPLPASGRRVSTRAAFFSRFDGDRVAEVRDYADTLSLLAQIGAVPEQSTPSSAGAATRI
ncbi:MAG TPA: ester cyclase [Frankiaceae bacterium]|nr:ester cyclase [Frankiaceae bacterium]